MKEKEMKEKEMKERKNSKTARSPKVVLASTTEYLDMASFAFSKNIIINSYINNQQLILICNIININTINTIILVIIYNNNSIIV
jgi:hypothetical protein